MGRARVLIAAAAALVAATLVSSGCGDDDGVSSPPEVVAVIAAPDSIMLPAIQATYALQVKALYSDASEADVTTAPSTVYVSEETSVAGVGGGIVSAAGAGSTRLIATFAGMSDTIVAIVDEDASVELESIVTEPATSLSLVLEQQAVVRAAAVWENGARLDATGPPFVYESSDPDVAPVSPSGVITGQNSGSARITISFRDTSSEVMVSVSPERLLTYEDDVYPIIFGRCTLPQCHSGNPALPAQRGLRLDTYENVMLGGVNGPVVVPGHPESSRLVLALRGVLPSTLRMPLGTTLTPRDFGVVYDWIAHGACRTADNCPPVGGDNALARHP